jgi:hypothetical protein
MLHIFNLDQISNCRSLYQQAAVLIVPTDTLVLMNISDSSQLEQAYDALCTEHDIPHLFLFPAPELDHKIQTFGDKIPCLNAATFAELCTRHTAISHWF